MGRSHVSSDARKFDMYCCLKAAFIASNRLDAGPAPRDVLALLSTAPDMSPGLKVGIAYLVEGLGIVDDDVVKDPSSLNPRPLQAPTRAAFLPLPCLNRDFLNHELCKLRDFIECA